MELAGGEQTTSTSTVGLNGGSSEDTKNVDETCLT